MATRWQNYINKRLDKLLAKTDFDKPKSRQTVYRFVNYYWKSLKQTQSFQGIINKLHLDNDLTGFVKQAPRLISDTTINDQRLAKIIVEDKKLWSRLDPARRWWAIFSFLPFVKKIIIARQEKLKQRGPLFGAKLEGKSLFEYFFDNLSAKKEFAQGISNSEESNKIVAAELFPEGKLTPKQIADLYFVIMNEPEGWDRELRSALLQIESTIIRIRDAISVKDAEYLMEEFDFLQDNSILNDIVSKFKKAEFTQSKNESVEEVSAVNLAQSIAKAINPQLSLDGSHVAKSKDPGTPPDITSPHKQDSEDAESESQDVLPVVQVAKTPVLPKVIVPTKSEVLSEQKTAKVESPRNEPLPDSVKSPKTVSLSVEVKSPKVSEELSEEDLPEQKAEPVGSPKMVPLSVKVKSPEVSEESSEEDLPEQKGEPVESPKTVPLSVKVKSPEVSEESSEEDLPEQKAEPVGSPKMVPLSVKVKSPEVSEELSEEVLSEQEGEAVESPKTVPLSVNVKSPEASEESSEEDLPEQKGEPVGSPVPLSVNVKSPEVSEELSEEVLSEQKSEPVESPDASVKSLEEILVAPEETKPPKVVEPFVKKEKEEPVKIVVPQLEEVIVEQPKKVLHPFEQVELKDYEWDKKSSLYKHVKDTSVQRNVNAEDQFARVVDYIGKNLENPGPQGAGSFDGPLAANMLKKWMFSIAHCDVAYKRGGVWNWFSQPYDNKEVPVAGIIGGVVRMTIEFDHPETAQQFFRDFLWEGHPHARAAATHGAMHLSAPEVLPGVNMPRHFIETKPSLVTAGANAMLLAYSGTGEGHYGINLALGGAGNKHYLSGREINNKGENGHIYMYYLPQGAIVIGIEQSAPSDCAAREVQTYFGSVYDNVGGGHDMMGTPNDFGPVGNDCFAKKPKGHEGEGVTQYGPDEYYKSMHMFINAEQLKWLQENFNEHYPELRIDLKPVGTIRELKSTLKEEDFVPLEASLLNFEDLSNKGDEGVLVSNESSIDDGYSQKKIRDAINILNQYLVLRKESTEEAPIKNCEKVQFLIDQLSAIRNIGHFIEIINEIEIIRIESENNSTIAELVDQGSKLTQAVREEFNLLKKEGDIHTSVIPGIMSNPVAYFWYTGSELKKTLVNAHESLMEVVPANMKEEVNPGMILK